jgi:hypothetical protein
MLELCYDATRFLPRFENLQVGAVRYVNFVPLLNVLFYDRSPSETATSCMAYRHTVSWTPLDLLNVVACTDTFPLAPCVDDIPKVAGSTSRFSAVDFLRS